MAAATSITVTTGALVQGPFIGPSIDLVALNGGPIAFGGWTINSETVTTFDTGNPSDLVATGLRLVLAVANGASGPQNLFADGYTLPNPANYGWEELHGSATIFGPLGASVTITNNNGILDGFATGGVSVTVTKTNNADSQTLSFDIVGTIANGGAAFIPAQAPLHSRSSDLSFTAAGGALAGTSVFLPNSANAPFVPEPSSVVLLGTGVAGFLSVAWHRRRRNGDGKNRLRVG